MTGFRTRIAPTPSGYLHAGNAINFLITQGLAREQGGTVLLRIDDLDAERMRPEYVQDIFDSLQWLGIVPDEGPLDAGDFLQNWSQVQRLSAAHLILERLRSADMLFACTCSRRQLTDCTCREKDLPFDEPETAWRLRIPPRCEVPMNDLFSSPQKVDLTAVMPDPVLRQRNGSPAYQVVSLADDIRFGMKVVVRGEDLLPSSACQVYIARVLDLEAFQAVRFVHHPLLTDASGSKLSKSAGADSLRAMRDAGKDAGHLQEQAADMLSRLTAGAH